MEQNGGANGRRDQLIQVTEDAPNTMTNLLPGQIDGEHLRNDPDWVGGMWVKAYMRMHHDLIDRAKEIQLERTATRDRRSHERQDGNPTVADSLKMLRKEVFSLTPKPILFTGVVVSFVLTLLNFAAPLFSGRVVDTAVRLWKTGAPAEDVWPALIPNLIMYTILLFGSYMGEVLVGILFAVSGHTTVTRLRIKLFRNLVRQDIAFYDLHVSGELASRLINDSGALSNLVQFTTQTLFSALVKFVGSLLSMFLTFPILAIIATFITPFNLYLVKKTGGIVGYYGVVQNDGMAKANAVAVEVLGNIRTVQTNVGEDMEAHRFMERMNYFLRVIKATVYVETVLRFVSYGLQRARDVVILGVGMYMVATGSLSMGKYTMFSQYVALYEAGFTNMTDIWLNFKNTITSTGKFVQLLLREPRIYNSDGLKPELCLGKITLDSVVFAYAGKPDRNVLQSISVEVSPGTILALVGESGAGKTTMGRLLQRHYDPIDGRVLLDDVDYKNYDLRWLRGQIGVVEQEPVLFDRPLLENIAYGSAQNRDHEYVYRAARIANAHEFILALDDGYMTHPGERACRISGGQKQRVAIARAVVRDPKVLILDEATSALDGTNEFEVQQALDTLMEGKSTVIIAHRLSTVVRATKILVLHQGHIIESGTHQELVEKDGKYASFMKHQLVSPLLS